MMKKLFAIMLVLAMLVCAAAVAEAADVCGTWYLTEITMNGAGVDPSSVGMSMTITLNEDGTASAGATVPGQGDNAAEGTWTLKDGVVTIEIGGAPQDFTFADGKLSSEMGAGQAMVFTQEAPTGGAFEPAAPKADAAEADYAGTWNCIKVGANGIFLDPEVFVQAMGADMELPSLTIEGTTVALNGFVFNGMTLTTAYKDGALTFAASTGESMVGALTLQLLEDDTLSFTMGSDGQEAVFIMARADA